MIAIKIAYLFEPVHSMTGYAISRARSFHSHCPDTFKIYTRTAEPDFGETYTYQSSAELLEQLKKDQPDILIRDAGKSSPLDIEQLRTLRVPIAVFDDLGDGAELADYQLQTLFPEEGMHFGPNIRKGLDAFIPLPVNDTPKDRPAKKKIVVAFPEKDPDNLTYRVLRHITNLHVQVDVDVLIHPDYQHDRFALQSFILQRKQITLIETTDIVPHFQRADLAITSAGHMPYICVQTATPAVLLAETKVEASYHFADQISAFIHLGLGRKIKQSALQNTIMEVLLHDALLEKRKQQLAKLNGDSPLPAILQELKQLAEQREFTS